MVNDPIIVQSSSSSVIYSHVVPDLPSAYEQNNAMKNLPNRLSDLVMRDDGNEQTEHRLNTDVADRAQHQLEGQHLKKIKGLPSLNMELSWR